MFQRLKNAKTFNMKNINIVALFSLLIVGSCSSDKRPDDVLSEAQMSSFLLDIYKAESGLAELRLNRDTTIAIFKEYESFLYEKHQVETEVYMKSLTYYYDHPDQLGLVYDIIIDSLTLRESKIKAIEESQRQKRDSLAKATRKEFQKKDSVAADSIKSFKP